MILSFMFPVFFPSSGQSTVTFDCVKETDLILIHSNKLNYTILDSSHIVRLGDSDGEGTRTNNKLN